MDFLNLIKILKTLLLHFNHMNKAKITINRMLVNVGRCDLLHITLDDRQVASLSHKKGQLEISVDPGIHLIYARLGLVMTAPLLLKIEEGERIRLMVKSYIHGIQHLAVLPRFICGDHNMIYLERNDK